jgi:hypothetical protein
MTKEVAITELARLRNRHVAKLLTHLGETPPYLETAIKKSFSMFADDVQANIINDNSDNSDTTGAANANGNKRA